MLQLRNYLTNGSGGGELLNFPQFRTVFMAVATCGEGTSLAYRRKAGAPDLLGACQSALP